MLATAMVSLFGLLLLAVPIAAVLFFVGVTLGWLHSPIPVLKLQAAIDAILWTTNTNFILLAIPLFVLLGEILLRSGVAERVYDALDMWLSWLPGGLMHANIATAMMFSATSGSSVATAATVGTIALPQGTKHGYNERLFAGSVAAGGTLGILIPPSINLIVYGVLTETSIPRLFVAGILPGLILSGLFMLVVLVSCMVRPQWGGRRRSGVPWKLRLRSLVHLLPIFLLFVVVVGSINSGLATPTEAAAVAVLCAFGLAAFYRGLTLKMLREAVEGTMRTTAMLIFILLAAYLLNFVLSTVGLTRQLRAVFNSLDLTSMQTMLLIVGFYVVLGFFVESLSMMVITIPVLAPIVFSMGFDPIWFGIMVIVLVEMALVTPPVGMNLYVVQGIRGGKPLLDVMIGVIPFVVAMLVMVLLLLIYPNMALYLPNLGNG